LDVIPFFSLHQLLYLYNFKTRPKMKWLHGMGWVSVG
jgi:hypothetical protein